MITFLPFPCFHESAVALDRQRLGKQRVEVKQLVNSHLGLGPKINHPASTMWRGFTMALIEYGMVICTEWRARGYRDEVGEYLTELFAKHASGEPYRMPPWLGVGCLHSSHRSRLVFKDPGHYRDRLCWTDNPLEPYLWPQRSDGRTMTFRYGSTNGLVTIPFYGAAWDPIQSKS